MMFLSSRPLRGSGAIALILIVFLLGVSCEGIWKKEEKRTAVARVGESFLYKDEVEPYLFDNMSKGDSASIVNNFINTWATKQLLLSKSKINLPEEKLREFDRLVSDYRTDLYTRAYKDALVQQALDTTIDPAELKTFYANEKENFKLKEKLVKLRFVELPKQFLKKNEILQRMDRYNERDRIYLDSVAVQFTKVNFNDSAWVKVSRVVKEIAPLTFDNEALYLKKSQFFELQDSLGVYLGKVTDVLNVNDVAPLSFIKPNIEQVLLNRRRLEYMRRLEAEIMDEAIKKKEFEIYIQDE
ncbi:MAG: peptidyl-prolyl cis-trans isomerase [Sediminicola sp.]